MGEGCLLHLFDGDPGPTSDLSSSPLLYIFRNPSKMSDLFWKQQLQNIKVTFEVVNQRDKMGAPNF